MVMQVPENSPKTLLKVSKYTYTENAIDISNIHIEYGPSESRARASNSTVIFSRPFQGQSSVPLELLRKPLLSLRFSCSVHL
jgi:hypothetical protein